MIKICGTVSTRFVVTQSDSAKLISSIPEKTHLKNSANVKSAGTFQLDCTEGSPSLKANDETLQLGDLSEMI